MVDVSSPRYALFSGTKKTTRTTGFVADFDVWLPNFERS